MKSKHFSVPCGECEVRHDLIVVCNHEQWYAPRVDDVCPGCLVKFIIVRAGVLAEAVRHDENHVRTNANN